MTPHRIYGFVAFLLHRTKNTCQTRKSLYNSNYVAAQQWPILTRFITLKRYSTSLFCQCFFRMIAMMTVEQIVAAQKAQIATVFELSSKALSSVEQLNELNLQAAKASLDEQAALAQSAMSVKDVQALVALQTSALQPLAEKAAAYSRHLYDIASGVGAEVGKMAEAQAAEAQKQFAAAVDAAVKNAPQGSEAAVAAVKTAMANANTAMESVQKAVKQAKDMAESNMKAMSAAPAGKKTAKA